MSCCYQQLLCDINGDPVHVTGFIDDATGGFAVGPVYTNTDGTTYTGAIADLSSCSGSLDSCFSFATDPLDVTGTDIEAALPAAGQPEFFVQCVTNGITGSEMWIVLADTNGAFQWHQIA